MRENLGIIVQYKVKIRLFIAGPLGGGELSAELPFTLTHAKSAESEMPVKLIDENLNGITNPQDIDLIKFDRFFFSKN